MDDAFSGSNNDIVLSILRYPLFVGSSGYDTLVRHLFVRQWGPWSDAEALGYIKSVSRRSFWFLVNRKSLTKT